MEKKSYGQLESFITHNIQYIGAQVTLHFLSDFATLHISLLAHTLHTRWLRDEKSQRWGKKISLNFQFEFERNTKTTKTDSQRKKRQKFTQQQHTKFGINCMQFIAGTCMIMMMEVKCARCVLCAWADSISDFTNSIYCRQQSGGWWWCDELNTQNPREQLNNEQNSTHNSEIWMWNLIKIHMRESNQTTNRQTICAELGKRSRTATKSRVVSVLCMICSLQHIFTSTILHSFFSRLVSSASIAHCCWCVTQSN